LVVVFAPEPFVLLCGLLLGFVWSPLGVVSGVGEAEVGAVGSVGLPADGWFGVTGVVESFGVVGVGAVDGVSIGGAAVLGGAAVPDGGAGAGAVDGEVEFPDGEAGGVDGAVELPEPEPVDCCAIAAVANIAAQTSESRRVDFREKLVMGMPHQGKVSPVVGWRPTRNGCRGLTGSRDAIKSNWIGPNRMQITHIVSYSGLLLAFPSRSARIL
jgi:hypothetical protein